MKNQALGLLRFAITKFRYYCVSPEQFTPHPPTSLSPHLPTSPPPHLFNLPQSVNQREPDLWQNNVRIVARKLRLRLAFLAPSRNKHN